MLPDPTFEGNRVPQGQRPIIRYVFDASIAAACLTVLGFALCWPL